MIVFCLDLLNGIQKKVIIGSAEGGVLVEDLTRGVVPQNHLLVQDDLHDELWSLWRKERSHLWGL